MKKALIYALLSLITSGLFAQEVTKFTAAEPSGVGPVKRLVKGGVPLPEGKFVNIDGFSVSSADGKTIPVEFTLLGKWLDGSAKWVLIEFPEVFNAGEVKSYSLVNGAPVKKDEAADDISASDVARLFDFNIRGEQQVFKKTNEQVKELSDSSVKKSWLITGVFEGEKDKTEKADYYVRVDRYEGLPGLFIKASLTADCAAEWMKLSAINFTVRESGKLVKLYTEKDGIKEEDIGDTPVVKGFKLRTDKTMNGWAAVLGENGTVMLSCEDFGETGPKAFIAGKNELTCGIYYNEEEPFNMKQGSATTAFLRLTKTNIKDKDRMRSEGVGAMKNIMPVCPPGWYVNSKAFGMTVVADKEKYPKYEAMIESNFKYVNGYQLQNNEFGIKNYGDYVHNKHWGNLHYDLPWVMFEQFARSGDLRFFNRGVSAARHGIDVDHIWHHSNPKMVGGFYVEGDDHNAAKGTYVGFAKNHGDYYYYYLTGDERAYTAGNNTGDYAIAWTSVPKDLIGNEERVTGYGLLCILQSYKATQDPKYLKQARFVIDVIRQWQDKDGAWAIKPELAGDPRPKSPTNGCVFMLGSFFEAMIDYYEITKEADVRDMIIKGNEYLINTLWKDGPENYSINLLVLHAPAWCYEQTKDKKFMDAALAAWDISIGQADWAGGKMLAQHWRCGPRFLYQIENHPEYYSKGRF